MKATVIKGEIQGELQELIPTRFWFRQAMVIKCEEEGTLLGAAVMEEIRDSYQMSWIWVKKEYRRQGVGNQLLDAAIVLTKQQNAEQLFLIYDSNSADSAVISYMLAKRRFELQEDSTATIHITRQQLLEAPLYSMQLREKKNGARIIPLQYLTPNHMHSIIRGHEKRNAYMISRADYLNADRRYSMVLAIGEKLGGIALVRPSQEKDAYILDLLFLDKAAGAEGIRLLKEVLDALLSPAAHLNYLEFACVGENALPLAQKLLGNIEITWEPSTEGRLWI